jgi:hypothetical protein
MMVGMMMSAVVMDDRECHKVLTSVNAFYSQPDILCQEQSTVTIPFPV